MALWDIVAKAVDLPLYKVLGGRTRDRVPIYFSGIYDECKTTKEAYQTWSHKCVDRGWKACKTARFFGDFYPRGGGTDFGKVAGYISAADVDEGRRRFEWVRDAVGDRLEVGLDLHASFDVPSAIRIGEAVRDLDPYFIEEPIQPHNVAALKEVREGAGVPIAAGERIFSRWGFKEILELNAADVLNPDLAWTGGISELKKIATLAESYYVPISPHDASGPINVMAGAQVMMTVPNFYKLETNRYDLSYYDQFIDVPLDIRAGDLYLPDKPGLGVELVPESLERFAIEGFGR